MTASSDLRRELGSKISEELAPLLRGRDTHICLIDPPGYPNVGDSAIFVGELDYIEQHHPRAKLSFFDSDSYTAKADKHIEDASVILLNGGGNFGDLWMHHQDLRKAILRNFPHKRVVQLPQSITFAGEAELNETRSLIAQHSDFHLMVRDTRSQAFALKHFDCPVILCPDMAFAMRPIARKPASADVHCLLRQDKEAASDHGEITAALKAMGAVFGSEDWLDDPATFARRLDRKLNILTRDNPGLTAAFRPQLLWARRFYARERMDYGVNLLSRGRYVVTDRLHAHILSTLMGIPNFVFDSLDGKVSAFHETWVAGRADAWLVSSPAELTQRMGAVLGPVARAA